MIKGAELLNIPELSKCTNKSQMLTILQHYELGTRLLDVTTNPLVALYFSCCSEFDRDGVIYYASDYPF